MGQSSTVVKKEREKQRIWVTDQELSSSSVQLSLLVTNSQRNIRETGQYFCLDKRQKERFGDVDSWVITTEKIGGAVDSDEIQNKMWRENEIGSRIDSCKERREKTC